MVSDAWRARLRWFAAEFVVVVIGILTALALQAWWKHHGDRQREAIYLRQLVADLDETERLMTATDPSGSDANNSAKLLRAYYQEHQPPVDSISKWIVNVGFAEPHPVLGTVEALISTGDISLLHDPAVASSITKYLENARGWALVEHNYSEEWRRGYALTRSRVDPIEARVAGVRQEVIDSLARFAPRAIIPAGPRRHPFPLDVDAMLNDHVVFEGLLAIHTGNQGLERVRRNMVASGRSLRRTITGDSMPARVR